MTNKGSDIYKNAFDKLLKMDDNVPVDIIIRTHGGPLLWAIKICTIIKNRKGKVRVFIDGYAHSAGTIIALTADEIYMINNSSLSAIDPQFSPIDCLTYFSSKDISKLVKGNIKDNFGDHYDKFTKYYCKKFSKLLNSKYDIEKIIEKMYLEPVDHSVLFHKEELEELGIETNEWDGKVDSIKEEKDEN